jgi:hypothetical protein
MTTVSTTTQDEGDRKAFRVFAIAFAAICILPPAIATVIVHTTAPVAFHAEALS